MKLPLQLTLRDIPHSEAVEAVVREKAAKLDLFYPRIMRGQVVIERAGRYPGKHFGVRIDLSAPGRESVVNREHGEVKHHAEAVATGIDPG